MEMSSKLLERAVAEISQLPGIGKRTALRLALYLLKQPEEQAFQLADALRKMREEVRFCRECHNISDAEVCDICANPLRDGAVLCVVEDIRDVMAIENTGLFRGRYHVLGGKISPIDGVGPGQLTIGSLVARVRAGEVSEVIFALSPTMEGDTTNFYIYRQLAGCNVKTSVIARGIAIGDELEFADEVTLGRSLINRMPFENSISG